MATLTPSANGGFYAHLLCDHSVDGNSANKFKCALPSEVRLPYAKAWYVCLTQFICTQPMRKGRTNDDVVVCLKEAVTSLNKKGIISTHKISMADDYLAKADGLEKSLVHSYQPRTEESRIPCVFPLHEFSELNVTLEQQDGRPLYLNGHDDGASSASSDKDKVEGGESNGQNALMTSNGANGSANCSLTLHFFSMDIKQREEISLFLKSKETTNYADNKAADFTTSLSPYFDRVKARRWYLGLQSISIPTRYSMFPGIDLEKEHVITLRIIIRQDDVSIPASIAGKTWDSREHAWVRDSEKFKLKDFAACDSLSDVVEKLTSLLSGPTGSAPVVEVKESSRKIEWTWKEGVSMADTAMKYVQIELPLALALVLGLANNEEAKGSSTPDEVFPFKLDDKGKKVRPVLNYYTPQEIYVNTSCTVPVMVGDKLKRVVGVVAPMHARCLNRSRLPKSEGIEFAHVQYCLMDSDNISEMKITLTDAKGDLIEFYDGLGQESGTHINASILLEK